MSEQIPHILQNNNPNVNFGKLSLYEVILGPVELNCGFGSGLYEHKIKPEPSDMICTINVNGYICSYIMTNQGQLILESYLYPFTDKPPTPVKEKLEGNFFLVMQEAFQRERTYIPFINGYIVNDKSKWISENSIKIDYSSEIEASENSQLNQIIMLSSCKEQVVELCTFISTSKSSEPITRAIQLIENNLNQNPVGWMRAKKIAHLIRNWPNEYKDKGQSFLNVISNQLLSQAKDPDHKWTRPHILKTIANYFSNTDAIVEAKELLSKDINKELT